MLKDINNPGEGMLLPKVIYGTSSLGNLYEEIPEEQKRSLVHSYIQHFPSAAMFDSAGKYGAGLALEVLGRILAELKIPPQQVMISNKLGWFRTPLTTAEPTFEKGVWKNITNDAVQKISYDGIMECYEQGNTLLGEYRPALVSVHDPDEYLAAATTESDKKQKLHDITEAYRALNDLKSSGKVSFVGIGAKDWKTIRLITETVDLDWIMLANSLTIYHHPEELTDWVTQLRERKVKIINSAVFNGGFLVGSDYFNYRLVDKNNVADKALLEWRQNFFTLCRKYDVLPAHACIQFGISIPGINSVALNSTSEKRMEQNLAMTLRPIGPTFWKAMKESGLIASSYPYLG
jgi:D-threo-aldose 1-dehydrogenase